MVTKVAFVCVHNSCRSQIAEALGHIIGLGTIKCYSAGTEPKKQINNDTIRLMKELGIDLTLKQYPKLIAELPPIDILITMGCKINCPFLPCKQRDDWEIEDPTGKSDSEYQIIIEQIKNKLEKLLSEIRSNRL